MIIELKGRKAVVTGSTAGIGRAIAEGLARAGASVVINGRGEERVSAALREMRENFPAAEIAGYAANLATPQGADAFVAQAADADILGANCLNGPQAMLRLFQRLPLEGLLSAFPNAGYPKYHDGRYLYFTSPEYFAN